MARRLSIVMRLVVMSVAAICACSSPSTSSTTSSSSLSATPSPPSETDERTPTDVDRSECVAGAVRYYAFVTAGRCVDVEGKSGTWRSHPLFPDAPPEVRETACSYQWVASSNAPADVDALTAIGVGLLTKSAEDEAVCEAPTASVTSRRVAMVDGGAGPPGGSTGVTGCDVCGRLVGRRVFVILPADMLKLRAILVSTEDGKFLTFAVQPSDGAGQVYSAELPPRASGSEYEPGSIRLFEAKF